MTSEKKRSVGKNYDLEKRAIYWCTLCEKDLRIRRGTEKAKCKRGKRWRILL